MVLLHLRIFFILTLLLANGLVIYLILSLGKCYLNICNCAANKDSHAQE